MLNAQKVASTSPLVLDGLMSCCAEAESAADRYETEAREAVRRLIAPEGKVDAKLLEREQFAAHGFAWIATYVSARRPCCSTASTAW